MFRFLFGLDKGGFHTLGGNRRFVNRFDRAFCYIPCLNIRHRKTSFPSASGRFEVKKEGKRYQHLAPQSARAEKPLKSRTFYPLFFDSVRFFLAYSACCLLYAILAHFSQYFFLLPRLIMGAPQETHLSGCVPSISASNAGSAGSTALRKYLHKSE